MEAILILLGMCLGVGLTIIFKRRRPVGTLRVDQSDSTEAPYLFLDLDEPVNSFRREKYVTFKVRNENYISRK